MEQAIVFDNGGWLQRGALHAHQGGSRNRWACASACQLGMCILPATTTILTHASCIWYAPLCNLHRRLATNVQDTSHSLSSHDFALQAQGKPGLALRARQHGAHSHQCSGLGRIVTSSIRRECGLHAADQGTCI